MTPRWLLAAAAAVWVLLGGVPSAAVGTRVVFTVDVESNESFPLPNQISAVCQDGSACGLMEIVRMLDERGWPGTYFLDVYERRQWGDATMRNLAASLRDAGQDVALHTHPQWAYDAARRAMYQYSLDEQTAIIADGKRALEQWTGVPVTSHRAGAYTADERTLVALQRNGVLLDSSLFWQHPQNHLSGLGLSRNVPSRYAGVLEIPATAYLRDDTPQTFGWFAPVTSVRKIDPNWFVDADEATHAIDSLVASDLPVIVVFLHSFSLMSPAVDGKPPVANRHAIEMLRVILTRIASHGLRVVTFRDLAKEALTEPPSTDVIPRVSVAIDFPRYAWHRLKTVSTTARWVAGVFGLVCLGGLAGLAALRRRTRRSAASSSLAHAPRAALR